MAGIGDLVANLAVNTAPWSKGLNTARGQFSSFTGNISSMIAPLAGVIGGVWGAKESISAYSESLANARKLEAVLQATGGAAGLTSQQIADYAGELQAMTNFEDDATIGAAAMLAAFTNVRGEVFFSAIDAAADLTAVIGGDLQSNVKLLGKALNDPAEGLAKLSRAGVQFTEEQTAQISALQKSGDILGAQGIILDVVTSKFGGAAKATADPLTQLSNTVGDVAENIGSALLPALSVGAEYLTDLLGVVVGGGDTFKEFGIEAAVQLSSIGQYIVLAATQFELWFIQLGEGASHFFTESFPAYLNWFSDNWQDIFTTIASNTLTIIENLGSNIGSAMRTIWDYISSGGKTKLEFAWEPLNKGFINTIKELPDIPERVVGEFEKSLAKSIEDQGTDIAESQQKMRDKLTAQFSPLKTVPGAGASTDLEELGKGEKEKATKAAKDLDLKASLQGSSEAAAIFTRGANGNKVDKQIKLAEQLLTATKEQTEAIRDFAPLEFAGSNA